MPAHKRGTQGLMEGVFPGEGTAVDVGMAGATRPKNPAHSCT